MKKSSNKRMKYTEEVKDDKSQSSGKKRNLKSSSKEIMKSCELSKGSQSKNEGKIKRSYRSKTF
jgi:hypothetical protein